MDRRAFLIGLAAACKYAPKSEEPATPKGQPFKLAVCNETFQGAEFAEGCELALATGYTGLEVAPWTLSEDPASLSPDRRREYRSAMEQAGVAYVGLHSLLTAPAGELHITTPADAVRERSWEYFRRLIDLCADLGDDPLMILGSGRQRRTTGGSTVEDAVKRLRDGLASVADHAGDRGVTILPETLAPHLCNVLTSMRQTRAVVDEIGHPAIQTMFDTHNAVAEEIPHDDLIRQHADLIKHVHINEMDGRHPGTGDYDFSVPLRALEEIGYTGWLSLEVFNFEPSGEEIARLSAQYLRQIEATLELQDSFAPRP